LRSVLILWRRLALYAQVSPRVFIRILITQDIPLYLAGGGAILCPNELKGISKVHRFAHYQCANAVGAAIAQVSSSIDTVLETGSRTLVEIRKDVEKQAIAQVVATGGIESSVKIIEAEALPISYIGGKCRFIVKAAGEWDGVAYTANAPSREDGYANGNGSALTIPTFETKPVGNTDYLKHEAIPVNKVWSAAEILAYRPDVKNGEWSIGELDAEFIAGGAYILGCGGGGDPETPRLALVDMLRRGAKTTVIDIMSVADVMSLGWGGMLGSPEVGSERLLGEEYIQATTALWKFLNVSLGCLRLKKGSIGWQLR
jgi:hypothetical protein